MFNMTTLTAVINSVVKRGVEEYQKNIAETYGIEISELKQMWKAIDNSVFATDSVAKPAAKTKATAKKKATAKAPAKKKAPPRGKATAKAKAPPKAKGKRGARGPSAWNLYYADVRPKMAKANPKLSGRDLRKKIGETWAADEKAQAKWKKIAASNRDRIRSESDDSCSDGSCSDGSCSDGSCSDGCCSDGSCSDSEYDDDDPDKDWSDGRAELKRHGISEDDCWQQVEVPGKGGTNYIVTSVTTEDSMKHYCTCPAFRYGKGKTCKHIQEHGDDEDWE